MRKFSKGEMVMTRLPGLQSKLEGVWEGPFEVLNVPSEFHGIKSPLEKPVGPQ